MAESFRILSQRETSTFDRAGRLVEAMEVEFETRAGDVGTVRVPKEQYFPEVVQAAVEDAVQRMDAVREL